MPVGADEVRRLHSEDARQGVAVGAAGIYAISDQGITRIGSASGNPIARWRGSGGPFDHLNSCIVRGARLICAASNYPALPMRSGVFWFDAIDLRLLGFRELRFDAGSLTWLDLHSGEWWAGFANYDGRGGAPGRDHRATVIVRYDRNFAERARYRLPATVLARLAPRSASGGTWGGDGLLYVTGHDRPELYVLALPAAGRTLRHVATLPTATHGQAIAWDPSSPRLLWSIERARHLIVVSRVRPVPR